MSLCRRSSVNPAMTHRRKKSLVTPAGASVPFDVGELGDQADGLKPVALKDWILSKGDSYGSVYLLPFHSADSSEIQATSGYRYRIVGSNQPSAEKQFYTLSQTGFTSFLDGEVGFLSLEEWVDEYRNYEKLRSISFFFRFKKTKSFKTWKCVVKRQKFTSAYKRLSETSCIFGSSKMRHCFLQVQALVGKLTDMGVTEILQRRTYDLDDFFSRQLGLTLDFGRNFGEFRNIVCQLVLDTCKSTFADAGFSSDEYELEVAEVERQAQREYTAGSMSSSRSSSRSSQASGRRRKPRKLTFIEQVNKRKVCERIVRFIRLIDVMMRFTAHMIVCNSLVAVHKSLIARSRQSSSMANKEAGSEDKASEAVESDTEIPVFSCKVILVGDCITITPDLQKFEDGFANLLEKLNEAVESVPVLFDDPLFNPYSQPVLYGKMENYKADYVMSPFIFGHEEKTAMHVDNIRQALMEAFDLCDREMDCYKATAREFCDQSKQTSEAAGAASSAGDMVNVETDVDSLKSKLANLTNQQSLAKGIKDQQNMSIFRADFKPLKRTILPNISKTIIQMQDALPKLGREKMEHFNEECKSLKDMIDFELKTSEDYVDNMDIKEKLQLRFQQLKAKLESIENVYLIMKNIPVPVSTEDKNSLKNLKSQLKSLGGKVDDKIKAHADILERFAETLESEQLALKDSVLSLLQEVRTPALLELEATADEVKPTLAKIEQMLKQASTKVLQYNQYEKKYGFHITEYLELVAAEQILASTNTVWKCTEDWEALYSKWASVEFAQLDVDDCEEGTAMIELELEEAKEIIGSSPMSLDLMAKVHATTEKLPVLKDLRTEALKERHWKQISEVVGADLTSTGKKLTLEILEKYNVFAYGKDISRIVRAASQEEQLDFMVNDLRITWTEQKVSIRMAHGMPFVSDFSHLHMTVTSSMVTLKELGQSRYSSQMKDVLMYWCDVVEKAERFIWLLAKAQGLWQYQEIPMTSLLLEEKHPSNFAYFKLIRAKFHKQMVKVASAEALIDAYGDDQDYLQLNDVVLGLEKTEDLLNSVLWSVRSDSPRLFFLTRSDLVSLLFECHNDLLQLYQYIPKIFPAVSSLILVEDTKLTIDKTGYHPEIQGIISLDGERIHFDEVMKVRLGVGHWVKYLGISTRQSLRSQLRQFFNLDKQGQFGRHWQSKDLSTQMQLVATHVLLCQKLTEDLGLEEVKERLKEMKKFTLETIKAFGLNEIGKRREVAKLLMLEYYLELASRNKTPKQLLDNLLVHYVWEEQRQVVLVRQADQLSTPYGYEYNGQKPLFDPSLAVDRVAFSLLTAVNSSGGICVLRQDARKSQLRSMCFIFGRPMFFVSAGIQDNFGEALVGAVITNTWIYVSVDDIEEGNRPLLRTLLMQLEVAMRFKQSFLEFLGQEIPLGNHTKVLLARTTLLAPSALPVVEATFKRFRAASISPLPLNIKLKLGLLQRGVSEKGLSIFLLIVVDRFMQFEEELGPQCIVVKMLNSIRLSISTSKLGIMQKFFNQGLDAEVMRVKMNIGQLVLDEDVYDIIKRHAKMTSEFKAYFEDIRNPSMVAAATSQAMVENCIRIQTSVSNFAMTCAVYPCMSNTVRRALRATATFLASQTGCVVYDICALTQLHVNDTLQKILRLAKGATGILHISGRIDVRTIHLLRNIAHEYPTLKILFSCNDKSLLNEIDTRMNCVKLKDDEMYNLLTAMGPCLSERLFGVVDKHFKLVFPVLKQALEDLQALQKERTDCSSIPGCQVIANERSLAITVGTALSKKVEATDSISSLLSTPELLIERVRESIDEARGLFEGKLEPLQIDQSALEPHVKLSPGWPSIFVPTQSLASTVQTLHFFLEKHISILLLGERGCGKSVSFSKVVSYLSKAGISVRYLLLGDSPNYEYEVDVLRKLTSYKSNVVAIENFNPANEYHVHMASSLVTRRVYFDERSMQYQALPNLTLLIESNCAVDQVPHSLAYNMVVARVSKDSKSNLDVLNEAIAAAAVQGHLSEALSSSWQRVGHILWSWHEQAKQMSNPVLPVSDHALYRALSGILAFVPEDIESEDDLLKFIHSELWAEYSLFASREAVQEELSRFAPLADLFKDKDEEEIMFLYQLSPEADHQASLPCSVQLKTVPDAVKRLMQSYAQLRGKQYNDRLVFSPHFTRQIVALVRAFCRHGTNVVVGPRGCGKTSAVTCVAHMLEMELVVCPLEDSDALLQVLKEAYCHASNENHRMLLVQMPSGLSGQSPVLDLINKIFHYYDIPGAFAATDKMKQLFDDEAERKEALLDPKVMVEAVNELSVRVKEHLHLVVTMTPEAFEATYEYYSNLFNKSGLVRMAAWPEETLVAIAEERFTGLEKDLALPIRNVSKTCAIIHLQMLNESTRQVTSTQFLDMVKILPQLYKPLQRKLLQVKQNLQTGIDQVLKANTHITKLTNEISEKEPEVLRLNSEIEQLNKRLSQERINLERASKAFRKKEAAARKKSEETQDLAADAHRNLEHALPSLDAAMTAVSAIDKAELNELRSMKNPPELAQQVLEAVCILLGLKADWNAAKSVTADSGAFLQKLLEFDKDNIAEQTSKRVRRYIDNPKFIPDEVAKVSRLCSSLCMWVRAIDLYAKIFKSIEPKRIRLLQAESELAEAMAALREETDRVAHIESTITSIQSNQQERIKRKANLEASIKQTAARLERAQLLSYSLEEESQRWKSSLIEVDKSLQMLVGNSVVAAMTVAYSGAMRPNERRLVVEKWRKICDSCKLETTVVPANDFLAPIMTPLKHWIGKFEYYCQNYLSLRMSNKWPLLQDPHGLALEALKAQNDNLTVVGMNEDRLPDILRQAISKGHEVLVLNYDPDKVRPGLQAVFHRHMTERIHAFVGLMGIPIMRRDNRVILDGQEVVCNPKFRLLLHTCRVSGKTTMLHNVKNVYNVVYFEYSAEALELQLLKKAMVKIDPPFSANYEERVANIRQLEQAVIERKDNVLDILLKTEGDVLDDKSVIVSLKDAKAKVFEILNDLNQERKELAAIDHDLPRYKFISQRMRSLIGLLNLLFPACNSSPLPVVSFLKLIMDIEHEEGLIDAFLPLFVDKVAQVLLPALASAKRFVLQMGCNCILHVKTTKPLSESFEILSKRLLESRPSTTKWSLPASAVEAALTEYLNPVNDIDPLERNVVAEQMQALLANQAQHFGRVLQVEQGLIEQIRNMSSRQPMLIYPDDSGALDAVEIICELARAAGGGRTNCPKYVSADLMTSAEVASLITNGKKEARWLIIDNLSRLTCEIVEAIPANVDATHRLFIVASESISFDATINNKVVFASLSHAPLAAVRKALYSSLLRLRIAVGSKGTTFLDGVMKLHEYLAECYPFCDQYRYLITLVKRWQQQGPSVTADVLEMIIDDAYGLDDSSDHHQLLRSILREIASLPQ